MLGDKGPKGVHKPSPTGGCAIRDAEPDADAYTRKKNARDKAGRHRGAIATESVRT